MKIQILSITEVCCQGYVLLISAITIIQIEEGTILFIILQFCINGFHRADNLVHIVKIAVIRYYITFVQHASIGDIEPSLFVLWSIIACPSSFWEEILIIVLCIYPLRFKQLAVEDGYEPLLMPYIYRILLQGIILTRNAVATPCLEFIVIPCHIHPLLFCCLISFIWAEVHKLVPIVSIVDKMEAYEFFHLFRFLGIHFLNGRITTLTQVLCESIVIWSNHGKRRHSVYDWLISRQIYSLQERGIIALLLEGFIRTSFQSLGNGVVRIIGNVFYTRKHRYRKHSQSKQTKKDFSVSHVVTYLVYILFVVMDPSSRMTRSICKFDFTCSLSVVFCPPSV